MLLTKNMLDNFKRNIDNWVNPSPDKTMDKVYATDRKQLLSVYNYCLKSEYKRAANLAYKLDTVVRDQIPNDVYDFLFPQ